MKTFKQQLSRGLCVVLIGIQVVASASVTAAAPASAQAAPALAPAAPPASGQPGAPAAAQPLAPTLAYSDTLSLPGDGSLGPNLSALPTACTSNPIKAATFVRDDEIILNSTGSASYSKPKFAWRSAAGAPWTIFSTGVGEYSALARDKSIEVVANHSGFLYHLRMQPDTPDNLSSALNKSAENQIVAGVNDFVGQPTLLERTPNELWAFSRTYQRTIRYNIWKNGTWGSKWYEIPGVSDVATSPAVVFRDTNHIDLFYTDNLNNVKFIEWAMGDWMDAPVDLGKQLASDLSAISINSNQVAVFGVEKKGGRIFTRQWLADKKIDWSDADPWISIGPSGTMNADPARVERPSLVSLSSEHIALSYRSSSRAGASFFEYNLTTRAWVSTYYLVEDIASPPTLVRSGADTLMLAAPLQGSQKVVVKKRLGGSWSDISSSASLNISSRPALVVWEPGEVVLLGVNGDGGMGADAYTGYAGPNNVAGQPNSVIDWQGFPSFTPMAVQRQTQDRAVLAKVTKADKTQLPVLVWAENSNNTVVLKSRVDPRANSSTQTNSLSYGTSVEGLTLIANDLDADGSQEVVLATIKGATVNLEVFAHSGVANTPLVSKASGGDPIPDANKPVPIQQSQIVVAAGDLDGDGLANEIAVVTPSAASVYISIYRYSANGLALVLRRAVNSYAGDFVRSVSAVIDRVDPLYPSKDLLVVGLRGTRPGFSSSISTPIIFTLAQIGAFSLDSDPNNPGGTPTLSGDLQRSRFDMVPSAETSWADAAQLDLAAIDLNGDGFKEVAALELYFDRRSLQLARFEKKSRTMLVELAPPNIPADRLGDRIAVGDLNSDGKEELIALAPGRKISIYRQKIGASLGSLKLVASDTYQGAGNDVLVGDIDNDALTVVEDGCQDFREVTPLMVLNAPPRWYPAQGGGVSYAKSNSVGSAKGSTTSHSVGGSVTVGFEHEFEVPVLSLKVGEVSASVTQDFSRAWASSRENSQTETWTTTYGFDEGENDDDSPSSLGLVVYEQTKFRCYFFRLPNEPAATRSMKVCSHLGVGSTGKPQVAKASFEQWNSPAFKTSAGTSWAAVGSPTNAMTGPNGYSSRLQIPRTHFPLLKVFQQREVLTGDVFPSPTGIEWDSSRDSTIGTEQSWETNTTISAGFKAGDVVVDTSVSFGFSGSSTSSTTEGTGQTYGVQLYNYNPQTCQTKNIQCLDYTIIPYVYLRTVKTLSGQTYQVHELDYYVNPYQGELKAPGERRADQAAGRIALQAAPLVPTITSPTHPDPATWYPTSTVTLSWAQPGHDTAAILGYDWGLYPAAGNVPLGFSTTLTQSTTFTQVPDGISFFSLRAKNTDNELGAVAERVVRVDTQRPTVTLNVSPSATYNGWHNEPFTVAVAASDAGSGLSTVEYSLNGTSWQPYQAPLTYNTNILTTTVWARATDNVGHVSTPVSVTFKLDMTSPTILDRDGNGLTYASTTTTPSGHVQVTLGGQLKDTGGIQSGQGNVFVAVDEFGDIASVDAVGAFPMLPGNIFTGTTETQLGWIYRPIFAQHGSFKILGYGTDAAHNFSHDPPSYQGADITDMATFFWAPQGAPDFAQTRITSDNADAAPGETVTFTIAVRNSGTEESSLIMTDTVPLGLTVLPESITYGGQYDPGSRTIRWEYGVAWPGETGYRSFSAVVDAAPAITQPQTRYNQLLLHPYVPDVADVYADPPEQVITGTVQLVPPAAARLATPVVQRAFVVEGNTVPARDVRLFIQASKPASAVYVREYTLASSGAWVLAQQSADWVPFVSAPGVLAVLDTGDALQGWLSWRLSAGDGVKMLEVRVANSQQQVSSTNNGSIIYTNLISPGGQSLAAGDTVQYRVDLAGHVGQAHWQLQVASGEAEVYGWAPRKGYAPTYLSSSPVTSAGVSSSDLSFDVDDAGTYIIEVRAFANGTSYRLVPGTAVVEPQTSPNTSRLPQRPLTLTIPLSGSPLPKLVWRFYQPWIRR